MFGEQYEIVYVGGDSQQGILSYTDDSEDEVNISDFLYFDKKLFKSKEDFLDFIRVMIKKYPFEVKQITSGDMLYGNFDPANMSFSLTVTGDTFRINIIVPKRVEIKTVEREFLILTMSKNGVDICHQTMVTQFQEIEFYLGNIV